GELPAPRSTRGIRPCRGLRRQMGDLRAAGRGAAPAARLRRRAESRSLGVEQFPRGRLRPCRRRRPPADDGRAQMNAVARTFAIAALTLKPSLRQPLFIILVSLLPFSLFVTFHVIGGAGLGQHALYGIMIVFATNAGVISLPQIAVTYRHSRLQEMYVASPVGPGMYGLGIGLSRLLF